MEIRDRFVYLLKRIIGIKTVSYTLLILTLTLQAYLYYSTAYELYSVEMSRGGKGYVSDEVWYVSSARVILNKVFNIKPRLNNTYYGLTLVYNSSVIDREGFVEAILDSGLNIVVRDTRYVKLDAVYVETNSGADAEKLVELLKNRGLIIDVIWGWRLPDNANINSYYNLEHAPLAKYLIGLAITLGSDNPIYWRIPSIIAGVLTNLLIYFTIKRFTGNPWLGNIASLIAGLDPLMRILSSIALLDIHVALWTSITLYMVSCGKIRWAILTLALGSLFKINTLLLALPIVIYVLTSKYMEKRSLLESFTTTILAIVSLISTTLCFQIISSIPLIQYFGLREWMWNSVFGAIKWHLSIKCVKPPCPVSSNPWDWFMGRGGFILYYYPNGDKVVAIGFYPLWLVSLTLALYTYPISRRIRSNYYASTSLIGLLISYIILWLAGNRQQYSFYSVQFIPLVYVNLIVVFYNVVLNPRNLLINIEMIRGFMERILRRTLELLSINENL